MSDMKTVKNEDSVEAFLNSVENLGRREDAFTLLELLNKAIGVPPKMWGKSIVGYGEYDYTRADGSEHKFMVAGFSPRKANLVVYLITGVDQYTEQLAKMGKYKSSVSCLYLPRLKNIDLSVLENVVLQDIEEMKKRYPTRGI